MPKCSRNKGETRKTRGFIQRGNLRRYFAPFKPTVRKRKDCCFLSTYFCEDLRLEENLRKYQKILNRDGTSSSATEEEIEDKVREGWKSKLSACRVVVCIWLCCSIPFSRFMFLNFYKREHFPSLCIQCVHIYFPQPVVSVDNWLHRIMESSSKEIETFFYPTQLAVFQKAKKQIEVKLIFCADEKKHKQNRK